MRLQTNQNMSSSYYLNHINQPYELNIISHLKELKEFDNKLFKKHHVQGIDTIGVFGEEPFSVIFKNNTANKVQVKISIDGTDTITGDLADTNVSKDMWVVDPYSLLVLKAWKETDAGGAQFIFSNANNSVAVHTHGNTSNQGIIAAAVFVESHVPETNLQAPIVYHYYPTYYPYGYPYYYYGSPYWWNNSSTFTLTGEAFLNNQSYGSGYINGGGGTYSSSSNAIPTTSNGSATYSSCMGVLSNGTFSSEHGNLGSVAYNNQVGVGCGEYVNQEVKYVAGLIKPSFTETLRVKYMWWDDLVSALQQEANKPAQQPSGFPADQPRGINLKNTPRIGKIDSPPKAAPQQAWARF